MARELPEEVLIEILSWLPIKPLLRFRSVSKTFLQLLTTNSQFMKLHIQRLPKSTNNHLSIVALSLETNTSLYYIEDCLRCEEKIKFEFPYDVILGVCNGLICVAKLYEDSMSEIFIWNPFIGDHITLPSPTLPMGPVSGSGMFSFGYHPSSNEYKVVRIVESVAFSFESHVEVYTLGMDSWRRLESISYDLDYFSPVLMNGIIHWHGHNVDGNVIVAFDIKDETFQEIPCPRGVDYTLCNVELKELSGLLSVIYVVSLTNVSENQVWVMKEYGVVESWTKEIKIGRRDVLSQCSFMQPVGVMRHRDIILRNSNSDVIFYEPNIGTRKKPKRFGSVFCDANICIGSLLSPKSFSGHIEEI